MDVVFTIDKNYTKYFCVALTSLLKNNNAIINSIYVVVDSILNDDLKLISDFIQKRYNKSIIYLELESSVLNEFKISLHISKATYFRLLLAEILPENINKILFLDSDIIVTGNLTELQMLDFYPSETKIGREKNNQLAAEDQTPYIYAVNHKFSATDLARLNKLEFTGNVYFNAGVMLVNLKKWRLEKLSERLIECAKINNDHLLWWDQDVLNLVLNNRWKEIDYRFNAFGLSYNKDLDYRIVHYISDKKPWKLICRHPQKKLFWKYAKMTPFYPRILFEYYLSFIEFIQRAIPYVIRNIRKFFSSNSKLHS